jgi:hypothetical protein
LTVLERGKASGELEVSAPEGRARIAVEGGLVAAIDAPAVIAPRMGGLLADGGVPADAVERIAGGRGRGVRIGDAVVRAGLAGRGAVALALRLQLRARARAIARWSALDLRFEAGTPRPREHAEPVRCGDLLVGAMREGLAGQSARSVAARLAGTTLVLTPLGEALIAGAPLWPDEQALAAVLRRPSRVEVLQSACRGSDRAMRLLLALRLLEGASPPAGGDAALLARKAREVRSAATARELLDLPRGARPDQVRRAWRTLAAKLHPDRFAASGQDPIVRVSNDVTSALQAAARELARAR